MKGVLLAGGTGTRLYPITHTGPKQLVPVANKPILEYAIEDLREAGIAEIGVVLGQKGREAIQAHLGDGSRFGVEVTYIVQGEPRGLAHAVGCARPFVGDEPFVVYLGDDLMQEGITDLVDGFDPATHAAGIGVQAVDEPGRYGVVELAPGTDGDTESPDVVGLVEKPDDPPSSLALIGVYVFTPAIFDQIAALEPSWRGELEITDAIQGLLDAGHRVQSHEVSGWWKDTGKPTDVLAANRLVLDGIDDRRAGTVDEDATVTGRVDLRAGATIEAGAEVRGPVSIGEDSRIAGEAYVGPYTSVGPDCVVEDTHLESTVVVGESAITADRRIVDSLIGRQANVVRSTGRRPAGDRLVVGRNSTLEL